MGHKAVLTVMAAVVTMLAAPALAHESGHVHPHGAEAWLAFLPAAVLAAVLFFIARSGR